MCVCVFVFDAFFLIVFAMCVCFFFVYSSVIYTRLNFCVWFYPFSINVFPIILVIIIIILSTTLFLLFANGLLLLPRTDAARRDVFPPCLLLWFVLGSVRGLEAKILAPNWRQRPRDGPTTMTAQSELSTEPRTCARVLQVWSYQIYLPFFCLVLFNIEVPNYIIKFTCCCCSCIVLYCFSSFFFWDFFNYIK